MDRMSQTNSLKLDSVGVVGLGLIGGSFARALKALNLATRVVGFESSAEHVKQALELGFVDKAYTNFDQGVRELDLILISTPVSVIPATIFELAPLVSPNTILTDAGSVKLPILESIRQQGLQHLRFVGGHPIAGGEQFGPKSGNAHLFKNKRFVLTPTEDTHLPSLELVRQLWKNLGCLVETMHPMEHDQIFAEVSHLPHLMAYATILAIANHGDPSILKHHGAGLKDYARIASSSPRMWSDIFVDNRECLLKSLDRLTDTLQQWRHWIVEQDRQQLESELKQAKTYNDQYVNRHLEE